MTAGVLNQLDSDQVAADAMQIRHIAETPFSPISEPALEQCRALVDEADAVIVTDVPIGHGNLPNLRLAAYALESGKQVILIEPGPFAARDYTDADAGMEIYERLITLGATSVLNMHAAVDAIHELRTASAR